MISMMTAKMGTPRMKAAKLRWSWATAHTASRDPIHGKFRYAGSLAASCACAGPITSASTPQATTMRRSIPRTSARRCAKDTWVIQWAAVESCERVGPSPE
jgi:hypothetical protein